MKIVLNYVKIINIFILILAFISIFKNKKDEPMRTFFVINLCIYFAIYLLIEVNARYYYNPQIAVIILAGLGFDRFINWIKGKNICYLKG